MATTRTRLDLILDRVKPREREVTIDTGRDREQIERIIAAAQARGLDACTDGRFVLVRDLRTRSAQKRSR